MDQAYYSTKQIADVLNVSKQRVYRCIKANHISEAHREVVKGNTVLMYDTTAFMQIKDILSPDSVSDETHHEVHQEAVYDTPNEAMIEALLKQLEIKDHQIAELNERLAEAHKALDQAQHLQALVEQKINFLENKRNDNTEPEQPGDESDRDEQLAPKRGFLKRIFKKYTEQNIR